MKRYGRVLERWALAGLGCGFLLVTLGRIGLRSGPVFPALVLSAFRIVLSVVVIALGVWLARSPENAALVRRVTAWGMIGGSVLLVLASWAVVSSVTFGEQYPNPYRNVVGGAMVGVLAGCVAGYYHEKSRQRARQLAEVRGQRLERLASLLSHDLRSPLDVAHGHLRRARSESDGDDEHLAEVERALGCIEELVEDTLLLVGQGGGIDERRPIELEGLADQCWGMVESGDAELVVEDDVTVSADRGRMATLFENLFNNAVSHGGEDVTVVVGELSNGFFVEDDGPGIPPEERSRVLELGYTGDTTTGSGLGLAIASEIVAEHGWDLTVTEGERGGARFEIRGVDTDHSRADGTGRRIGVRG